MARERRGRLAELGGRLLEELRHARVTVAALGARQQLVRDIADEDVLEAELLLAFDHRARLTQDQIAALERAEELRQPVRPAARDPLDRPAPEGLADDRGVEQQRPLGVGQRIEPCGDDAADRARERPSRL